ncbi:Pathogenesis-related protein 5 [Glycine soja]|uniref:Pathogenesis-related protein 5 n=1 Tax=Glycine soja TaxID=3848 RepID=A0A445L475_GLYSO|nr:Pathogenesis-related protein 5 [Glycine soja]
MPTKSSWNLTSLLILFTFFSCSFSYSFTIINNCPHTIWPGTLSGWSGWIWARTGCTFDAAGVGKCQTGDCGGRLECEGNGSAPPTSLFEITLGAGNGQDYYDVSMVDGNNLPLLALPRGVYGGVCNATGCITDINRGCPRELQLLGGHQNQQVVGCRSACEAFKTDKYCCRNTCKPSYYSTIFKKACPRSYSYAFDDGTSTFTCKAYEYDIVFCPNSNGMRRPNLASPPPIRQPFWKHQQVTSSSNILFPFPEPIFLLVLTLSHL